MDIMKPLKTSHFLVPFMGQLYEFIKRTTLICAPVRWGKTTLLATIARVLTQNYWQGVTSLSSILFLKRQTCFSCVTGTKRFFLAEPACLLRSNIIAENCSVLALNFFSCFFIYKNSGDTNYRPYLLTTVLRRAMLIYIQAAAKKKLNKS